MIFKNIQLLFFLITTSISYAQSLPIFLDGRTDDWNIPVPTYNDNENDGAFFDFIYFSVTNDENFLFIRLKLSPENKLVEDNNLSLYIDGDDNISSGVLINGIGAELKWDFGFRNGLFYKNGTHFIEHADILYRSMPTVTDTTYEIAIGRNVRPNNSDLLFSSQTIKILFKDNVINGDWMPDEGQVFSYTFDDTSTPPVDLIEISKEDTIYIRIVNYNTLQDGILDPNRSQYFTRILQAINADIMCFNENWNTTATQMQNKMNELLPLPGGGTWYAVKIDGGNITVTKYPIIQSWQVYPNKRITASLIDLPSHYENDILVINCHYKCCGGQQNDDARQLEADATIDFLLDAKTPGGIIDLPADTPFLILGDLNLVGYRQQLTTLVTGEIVNSQIFGSGGPPDWDDTDLEDLISQQSDKRTAYTWRNDGSSFPPGRLDFQIFSNSVMTVEKNFVIQTEVMSSSRLAQYSLQQFDTRNASDHFPKVTDYSINFATEIHDSFVPSAFCLQQNYPNPFNPATLIKYSIPSNIDLETSNVSLKVFDIMGKEIATLFNETKSAGSYEVQFDGSGLTSGVYYYQLRAQNFVETKKMLLLK